MRTSVIKAAAAALGLSTSVLAISSASAGPINLMGYTGPISIDFHDYESFTSPTIAPGDQNFGVFNIINITAQASQGSIVAGQTIWSPGGSNQFLVGVFNDITVTSITPNGSGGFTTENTGGNFSLYQVASFPNFTQGTSGYAAAGGGCTINQLCYNGISNTGSGPVLTISLIPGADLLNPASTLQATISGTTVPVSGSAQGYGDITGGTDQGQFGIDGFTTAIGTKADIVLLNNFCANAAGCSGAIAPIGNWQQLSNDPIGATAIPEPSSLLLLGSGILGLGLLRRKRRA